MMILRMGPSGDLARPSDGARSVSMPPVAVFQARKRGPGCAIALAAD
jgi:hypothetical protein